ncbi:PBP1A family penicillin-binding protein [Pseudoblastomonas halimionae]|uniref:PBP1A family penicillin-binding protein n=1 Tax=Alteriqipengyuania halimionae TaxID=1926630 RepID=A0A6I4U1M6_9SPHN|nr:PBP1A family penicillin-binding protein [Alteriqipengyuania halimionae]MXP08813.1 PBP1A family penicillin-binding protein [Alteriqipengyuania halimionae]
MPTESRKRRRKSARPSRRAPAAVTGWKLWLKRLFLWGAGIAILCALVLGIAVAVTMKGLPSYNQLRQSQNGQTIVVRARDGSQLVSLGPSYGEWIPYDHIPQVMKDAMVSVEDRRFDMHPGIDPIGLTRAAWVSVTTGTGMRATSTITQQLARNIFLNSSRTLDRKAREGVLAMALEAKFSKEQILELYLNKVYFGGGAYGIDSASRRFFGHSAETLSLEEAAIIAGLVKAPSRYSPTADADAAVRRAGIVLRTMAANGYITEGQAGAVDIDTVDIKEDAGGNAVRYFTDWVLPQLDVLIPVTYEPIEVWTTLDPALQETASKALNAHAPDGAQGALVSMDRDGAILAMVGGKDYVDSNYNRATQALRQPGSAWKLFVYLAALEAGYTPDDRVVDEKITIDGWTPRNSNGSYSGEMDVRAAFAYSKNTVAAKLGYEVGFSTVANMARRFGISTPINTLPAMVLGTSEVRVLDMTRAFAGISARGRSVEPYGIVRVRSSSGETLYEHRPARQQQLVPDYVAAGITDLLQTTVNIGSGRAANIGRPVAGKTGTTSSNKDGWFVGFSSGVTTGVWMGRDDAKAVRGLAGGAAPARAFAEFMRQAVAKRPVEQFDTDLSLPEWQLEPDEEDPYGDPGDYYYVDENGNIIDPNEVDDFFNRGERRPEGIETPEGGRESPPPAVDPDFLDRAINGPRPTAPQQRETPPRDAPPPKQRPAPSPEPSPRTTSRPVTQPID